MPEMGESVTEGIVLEWHVAEGDFVNEGDTVVEVSTDKVDAEVPAPADGVITKLMVASTTRCRSGSAGGDGAGRGSSRGFERIGRGSCRGVGGPAGGGYASVLDPPDSTPPAGERLEAAAGTNGGDGVRATPVARRVAEANGVDLGSVAGSGPGRR